jgi:adenylyltransferase/sulfurtransferase
VLIVGAGGLGAPVSLYLAAAGVGTLTLVDFDVVDESNLQRQVLFSTDDVGKPKLACAARRLREVNPKVSLELVDEPFTAANGLDLVGRCDVVIDGTDNFATRYLVNDAAVLMRTPNVFGSVHRFEGQVAVLAAPGGPCYRCLHPEPPPEGLVPTCAEAGVLGVLPGLVGLIQSTEALKLLTGLGRPLIGRLLLYDALRMRVREIDLPRDPDCPICGEAPTLTGLVTYEPSCAPDAASLEISVQEFREWQQAGRRYTLVDVREPSEHAASSIPGALLLPIGRLREEVALVPQDRPVVVHCKTGMRSGRAARMLRELGFEARSLKGGLVAWARVEPTGVLHK